MDNSRRSRKKGTKKKKHPLILLLIFLVGFAVAIYPLVSRYYYRIESNEVIKEFDETVSQMDKAELEERWRLAQAFNATLKPSEILDPFTEQEKKKGVSEYANMLKVHERIGYVEIPAIDQEIPMYVGTSEEILQKGAGLLEGASLPVGGENTHTVVTAHRGLPTAELFSQLDKMKKGDVFYLHVLDQVLAYQVSDDPDAVYGYLSIPSLEIMEPVYLGADYHHLAMGLAHVDGTPLPVEGKGIRSVIAGHRAEPSHVFFRHLDQLKVGDALYYDNGQEIVEYQMMDTEIILPSEWEKLESVSSKNIMTLITCDPIPTFNKRLLVNFERVAVYQKSDPQTAAVARVAFTKEGQSVSRVATSQWLYRGLVVLAFLGILFVLWKLARLLRGK